MSEARDGGGDQPLSFTNPKVQRLRRLIGRRSARLDEGAFVVEGAVLLREAVAAGWPVQAQFVAPGVDGLPGASRVHALAPGVAERIADTSTTPGLFAVVTLAHPPVDVLAVADWVVVVDRLADPGNLGTIVRSAEAAGARAVVVTPGTVDHTNPKVVRAAAGALFHVPVVPATLAGVRAAGLRLVGTSSHRGAAHTDADWSDRVALVLGSEAHGLADDAPVDDWVRIRHAGRAESLNVAMAATVLCFEVARRRASAAG